MTYDPTQYRDRTFPEGRPACRECGEKPVYLGGLCGDCYAAEGERQRAAAPRTPRECPYCGRVMSFREEDEQGACNDCSGGPADLGGHEA